MAMKEKVTLNCEETNNNQAKGKESKGRKSMGMGRKLTAWFGAGLMFCMLGLNSQFASAADIRWKQSAGDNNTWDGTNPNLFVDLNNPSTPKTFTNGDNVTFIDGNTASNIYIGNVGGIGGVRVGNMYVSDGLTFTNNMIKSTDTNGVLQIQTANGDTATFSTVLDFAGKATIGTSGAGTGTTKFNLKNFTFAKGIEVTSSSLLNITGPAINSGQDPVIGTAALSGTGSISTDGIVTLRDIGSAFTGTLNVSTGVLALSGAGSLGAAKEVKLGTRELNLGGVTTDFGIHNLESNTGGSIVLGSHNLVLTNTGTTSQHVYGVISGQGGVKIGDSIRPSDVTFHKDQTYNGITEIVNGRLALAVDGNIKESNNVTMHGGTTFDLSAKTVDVKLGALNSTGLSTASDSTEVKTGVAGKNLILTAGGTYYGKITGSGGLFVDGDNSSSTVPEIKLGGNNSYTGATTINGGKLNLIGTGVLTGTSGVEINEIGSFEISGNSTRTLVTLKDLEAAGTEINRNVRIVTIGGGTTLQVTDSGNVDGLITGAGNLAFGQETAGNRALVLSGKNTYTGTTKVENGWLNLKDEASIASSSEVKLLTGAVLSVDTNPDKGNVAIKKLSGVGGVNIYNGNTLQLNSTDNYSGVIQNGDANAGHVIAGTGSSDTVTFQAKQLYTGDTDINGYLKLSGAGDIEESRGVDIATSGKLDISGANGDRTVSELSGSGSVLLGLNDLTVNSTGNSIGYAGVISGSNNQTGDNGGVTYDLAPGKTYTLTGINTYYGATNVKAGTLALDGSGSIANSRVVDLNNDGKLQLVKSGEHQIKALTSNDADSKVILESGSTLVLNNSSTVASRRSDMGNYAGAISGAGGLKINTANQIFTLGNGNVSYTGATDIVAGTLKMDGSATLGNSSGVNVGSSGKLDLSNNSNTSWNTATLGGSGEVFIGAKTLTLTNGRTSSFSGTISSTGNNSGGLTVTGADTVLTLDSGAQVHAGNVNVGANATLNNAGHIYNTVSNGSILNNNGTIDKNVTSTGTTSNSGSIGGDAIINAGTFTNTGTILGNTQLNDGTLTGSGLIKGSVTSTSATAIFSASGTVEKNVNLSNGKFIHNDKSSTDINHLSIGGNLTTVGTTHEFNLLGSKSTGSSTANTRVTATGTANLGGTLDVDAPSAGSYNLVTGTTGLNYTGLTSTTGSINGSSATTTTRTVNGNTLQVVILGSGDYYQNWTGGTGANSKIWDATTYNWTEENTGSGSSNWLNLPGGVAQFTDNAAPRDITVDNSKGNVNFGTLKFDIGGYSLSRDALTFAPASGTSATINANNTGTTIINSQLNGNGLVQNLLVTGSGGGTVVLTNGNNNWTGNTTINGSTTLRLDDLNATGDGNVILNGGRLALNQTGNFSKGIADNGSANNTVEIMKDKTVTLTRTQDYNAKTVLADGATLKSGVTGAFSERSAYALGVGSALDLNGHNESIGNLSGDATSKVLMGANRLTMNLTDSTFAGKVYGDTGATLIKNGSGTLSLDSDKYKGALTAASGIVRMNATGEDLYTLNIADNGTNANNGDIYVDASKYTKVNLTGTSNFAGNVHLDQGTVVMDSGTQSALEKAGLSLDGVDADLSVTGAYTINTLKSNGGDIIFNGVGDAPKTLSTLTIRNGLTGSGRMVLDENALAGTLGGGNFFDNYQDYFLKGSVATPSGWEVVNSEGQSLKEGTTSYEIWQQGVLQGLATADYTTGVTNSGAFYAQDVKELSSYDNVTIDSSGAKTVNNGRALLDAGLTGGGGFTFTGTQSILVNNANTYNGATVINMGSDTVNGSPYGVWAGTGTAFGEYNPLEILSGFLHLNGQDLKVGAISGNSPTSIRFSSGLDLRTNDDANYYGQLVNSGYIKKSGTGVQIFSNKANSLTGNIDVNGGGLVWFGNLNSTGANSTSTGNVFINNSSATFTAGNGSKIGRNVEIANGTFIQDNSTVNGSVIASGATSTVTGSGLVNGNMSITNGANYLVGLKTNGDLDETIVKGATTFDSTTNVAFSRNALAAIYKDPTLYENYTLINSGTFNTNGWTPEQIDMGMLGTVDVSVDSRGNLVMDSYSASTDPAKSITDYWNKKNIHIGDVISHSNVADVDKEILTSYLDGTATVSNKYLNPRFANAFVAGGLAVGKTFTNDQIVSLFNYQSGISAAIPVDAAMDVTRGMIGRGLQNRITSLRAGRDTVATTYCPTPTGCYAPTTGYGYNPGFGYGYGAQPQTTSYATTTAYGDGSFGVSDWSSYGGETYVPATDLAPVYPAPAYGVPGYAGALLQQPVLAQQHYRANRVWASGIGDWIKHNTSDGGIGGFTHNAGGLMLGYDHSIDNFTIGAALAYTHGKLEDKYGLGSDSKMDSYAFTAYGDYNFDSGVNLGFFGGYELFDNKIDRRVAGYGYNTNEEVYNNYGREHEKYKSDAVFAGVNLAKDFVMTNRFTVTPSVGVTYTGVRSRSFDRKTDLDNGTYLTDSFDSVKKDSLQIPLEVAGAYDVLVRPEQKLTLMGNVGYAFECFNDGAKGSYNFADVDGISQTTFRGRAPGRNNWNVGVGARYQYRNLDFDLRYDFMKAKDSHSNRLGAAIGIEF